jgi:hypothetical protein
VATWATCVLFFAAAACVPSTDEKEPKGAAGFELRPSKGTAGETFLSRDGYAITVERLVVVVMATSPDATEYESTVGRVFPATARTPIFARAIPEGPATVSLAVGGAYLGYGDERRIREQVEGWESITAEEQARFTRVAESDQTVVVPGAISSSQGPAALLVLRATRGASTFRMNLTLSGTARFAGSHRPYAMRVERNALTTRPAEVRAEALFSTSAGNVLFQSFAAADVTRDGVLQPAELAQSKVSAEESTDPAFQGSVPKNPLELLLRRMQTSMLVVDP